MCNVNKNVKILFSHFCKGSRKKLAFFFEQVGVGVKALADFYAKNAIFFCAPLAH